jgi:spoIIIJ-associated protein
MPSMDYVEAEGDTIDEAIERALRELGVSRDRAEVEIIANATRGLFGLGGRKAKVRASLRSPLRLDGVGDDDVSVEIPELEAEPRPETTARRAPSAERVEDAALEKARSILQEIVGRIGADGTVDIAQGAEGPQLEITGDESGILIGRRGQTLDALEYVLNRIVMREEEGVEKIVVDSHGYRARRRDALVDLALRLGERARRRGRAVTLNPMSPRDRRVVHLALRDASDLTTRSSGKGYFRKLLIIPRGEHRRGRAPRNNGSTD